ncbi:MAG: PD-(D/E)XK nuclease family protein, partial [Oscillospiraceae bacterium]|nr:PD-(D/E)XK nuclease family protein [Oscillospiraceae bacterium]
MLKITTARAGHGKTKYAHEKIAQAVENHTFSAVYLIVPEQYAYISERDLIDRIGDQSADCVRVMSFTRLAQTLLRLPAEKFRPLTDGDRAVCMSLALEAVTDKLELYHNGTSGLVGELLRLRLEMRQSGADEKKLGTALKKLSDGDFLRKKLTDFSYISMAYDALCTASFLDEQTLLDKLCERLPQDKPFGDSLVILNAFHGLTGQELRVLGHILRQAKEVDFLLSIDVDENKNDAAGVFAHTFNTLRQLRRLASQCGVGCVISPPPNAQSSSVPALVHLERNLLSSAPKIYEHPAPEITIKAVDSIYDECAWTALRIKKYLHENTHLSSSDIAIISRDSSVYEAPLRSALRSCGLSLYQDSRQPIAAQPLFLLMSAALDIAVMGFRSDSVLQLMKTRLAGLDSEDCALLENYTFIWQIDGAAWTRSFTLHPRGLTNRPLDNDAQDLEKLEGLRKKLIEPLIDLRESLKEPKTGEELARELWNLLESYNCAEHLRGFVENLRRNGDEILAQEQARIWETMVDFLERLSLLIEHGTTAPRLREFFTLLLEAESLGSIPQGLDEPSIGSANRMRFCHAPKAVFVLGCNRGIFPMEDGFRGLLTAAEREKLRRLDFPLSQGVEEKQAQERFFVYHALCAAQERLFLSYRTQGSDGGELLPSEFINDIRAMFPAGVSEKDDKLLFAQSESFSFNELARRRRNPDEVTAAIHSTLAEKPHWRGKLDALERTAIHRDFALSRDFAKSFFGENLCFSASRAESYSHCPFRYFCQYGVKATPRKRIKIDPLSRGNLLHFVLEKLFTHMGREKLLKLSQDEVLPLVASFIEDYRRESLDGLEFSRRLAALLERNAENLARILWHLLEELRQSEFVPVGFEMEVGDIASFELRLPSGGKISFTGKIDRVDEAIIDGVRYLRVVDY